VFAPCVLLRRRGCLLHVERLELGGEAVQEDGRADDVCHLTFRGLGNVVADGVRDHRGVAVRVLDDIALCVLGLVFDPVFVQPRDGVDVREAHERTCRLREGWVELLDQRRAVFVLQQFVHRVADLRQFSTSEYEPAFSGVPLMGPYNRFDVTHEIVEGDERKLCLEVRIFAQMAASVAGVGEGMMST
jgi:hypothetical protein